MDSQTIHPKATEYVSQMIDFISGLIKKDAAYIVQGMFTLIYLKLKIMEFSQRKT